MPDLPISVPVDDSSNSNSGGGSSGPSGPGANGSAYGLKLGSEPEHEKALLDDIDLLDELQHLYSYARERNRDRHDKIDTLVEFAMGKQFATWGDEISHFNSRPKRNITFDIIRHKTGLVTEPPLRFDVLPRDVDADVERAQVVRAALEYESERIRRAEKVDLAVRWAATAGKGIIHQGWDPVGENVEERVVDPRLFDPDPDQPDEEHWSYCFETLRMPLDRVRALFPATGKYVGADNGTGLLTEEADWTTSNDAANVAARIGKGDDPSAVAASEPPFATIVFRYSQGHWTETEEEAKDRFKLVCQDCDYEKDDIPRAPDVISEAQREVGDEVGDPCPQCGFGPLIRIPAKRRKMAPTYPRGRMLCIFAPVSNVLLWRDGWPDPEIEGWPYKSVSWYVDPRSWWGVSETEIQWHMQLLLNKVLLLFSENATMNAVPKIILPKGICFEDDPWTNIPSQVLVAKSGSQNLIEKMRSFQAGDTPQSLILITQMVLRELRSQGGFDDIALGQIRGNTEISGKAIAQAQSAAEVPVRDHLRHRYRMETKLLRDNLVLIRNRWSLKRTVRLVDPWGNASIDWFKGDEAYQYDVVVTSEPQDRIERGSQVEIAVQLMAARAQAPGAPVDPLVMALLSWVGFPTKLLQAAMAKLPPPAPPGVPPGSPGMGGGEELPPDLLATQGMAAGLEPRAA